MKQYIPVRDLVLVEKIEEEKAIIMPDTTGLHFVRLKVLAAGVDAGAWKKGEIVWAENMLERIKPGENKYLILDKYIVCLEEDES